MADRRRAPPRETDRYAGVRPRAGRVFAVPSLRSEAVTPRRSRGLTPPPGCSFDIRSPEDAVLSRRWGDPVGRPDHHRHPALPAGHRRAQSANARIGPFLAGYDGNTGNPNRNYATPVADHKPTIDDVSALVAFYRRKNRLPRLEYVVPAGAVERSLTDAAFVVDEGLPLMTATDDSLRLPDLPPGIELRLARTEAELSAAAATQNAAYGEPGLDPADVRRLRRTVDAGGFVVAAVDVTGETVGAGCALHPWAASRRSPR